MDATKILHADILDILFDERNKAYGAYDLRRTYNRRIATALLITGGLSAALFISSFVANSLDSDRIAKIEATEVVITDLSQDERPEEIEPPPPTPPVKQVMPQIESTRFTPPRIVDDNDVKKEDIPPAVTDLVDTKIDVINQAGDKDKGFATPPVIDDKQVVEVPKPKDVDDNEVFIHVEIPAEFPGGPGAWSRFLHNHLNSNTPMDNGAPVGSYTVMVQFIVDKEGNISDVKALTNHGYGMEEEAIRVIKKGPQWTPAIQNGRKVNAYRRQPVTFIYSEE